MISGHSCVSRLQVYIFTTAHSCVSRIQVYIFTTTRIKDAVLVLGGWVK